MEGPIKIVFDACEEEHRGGHDPQKWHFFQKFIITSYYKI